MLLLFFVMFAHQCFSLSSNDSSHVVYWEIKPYLYTNEFGVRDGIFSEFIDRALTMCENHSDDSTTHRIVSYKKLQSREDFFNWLEGNHSSKQNHSTQVVLGFPWMAHDAYTKTRLPSGLVDVNMFQSKQLAVVMSRDAIYLSVKIMQGLYKCADVFVISTLLAVIFGMLIWLIEQLHNPDFNKSVLKGSGNALWFAFVTMTTVGYGDMVPRSVAGRSLCVVWMVLGVIISAVITATVTESISGTSTLDIYGKKVAVLAHSAEEKIAVEEYQASNVSCKSYDEVLQRVRDQEAHAGLLNADVAAWLQDELSEGDSPLHIVYLIEKEVAVNLLLDKYNEPQWMLKCISVPLMREELFVRTVLKYRRHCKVESVFVSSLGDAWTHSRHIIFLAIVATCIVCVSFLFAVLRQACYREKDLYVVDSDTLDIDNIMMKDTMSMLTHELCTLRNDITTLKNDVGIIKERFA